MVDFVQDAVETKKDRRDARDELANKIVGIINNPEMKPLVLGIMSVYDIFPKETAIIVADNNQAAELTRRFLVAKKVAGCTDRSCKTYYQNLVRFFKFVQVPPTTVQHTDIQRYLAYKITTGCSKAYQQNICRTLSSFYKWLIREEIITKDPTLKVDVPKVKVQRRKAFTDMDVELLRNACRDSYETALVEVMLSTACRAFEVGQRKDNNPYLFPASICADGHALTEVQKEWYKDPSKVSPTKHIDNGLIECKMRKLGKRAGVTNCHPHRFRRTCATWALRRGMPINIVQQMLGHSSLETTQRYLDIDDNELVEAHKKYVT